MKSIQSTTNCVRFHPKWTLSVSLSLRNSTHSASLSPPNQNTPYPSARLHPIRKRETTRPREMATHPTNPRSHSLPPLLSTPSSLSFLLPTPPLSPPTIASSPSLPLRTVLLPSHQNLILCLPFIWMLPLHFLVLLHLPLRPSLPPLLSPPPLFLLPLSLHQILTQNRK